MEVRSLLPGDMLVALVAALASPAKAMKIAAGDGRISYRMLLKNFSAALVPLAMTVIMFWGVWWYVVIHQQASNDQDFGAPTEQPSRLRLPRRRKPRLYETASLKRWALTPVQRQRPPRRRRSHLNNSVTPNCCKGR